MSHTLSALWMHMNRNRDDQGKVIKTKCNYCNMNISGSATRIQEHLYGTPECKFKNVAECKSEYARNLRAKGLTPTTNTVMVHGTTSTDPAPAAKCSRNRNIREMVNLAGCDALDLLWATAVVENDWAFRVSQQLKIDTEALMQSIKDSWASSGCSISVDGWSDMKNRGLVWIISMNDTAPVVVAVLDTSTNKKTGTYLASLIRPALVEVGDNRVVQVVMDNASNNKKAADELREGYPSIFILIVPRITWI
ncbi:hypothetical protein CLOM_g12365 [Closterium sp. NIES-68]|nr:hypothetical protein CLOM_g12365 [Closterium sp. NIES-68]